MPDTTDPPVWMLSIKEIFFFSFQKPVRGKQTASVTSNKEEGRLGLKGVKEMKNAPQRKVRETIEGEKKERKNLLENA